MFEEVPYVASAAFPTILCDLQSDTVLGHACIPFHVVGTRAVLGYLMYSSMGSYKPDVTVRMHL
jgi:hypothetical protein